MPPLPANMPTSTSLNDAEVSAVDDRLASLEVTGGQAMTKGCDTSADGDGSASSEDSAQVLDPELWEPHPPTEDCPVCFVPLPLAANESTYWACCGKRICSACKAETNRARRVTNAQRAKKKQPPLEHACSFCRTEVKMISKSQYEEQMRKGDGKAAYNLALKYRDGDTEKRIPQDEAKSLELLHHAADDLGFSPAMATLGGMYLGGEDVAAVDETKGRKYLEDATKIGNVRARFILGGIESEEGNIDIAVRHWKLAAAAGEEFSVKMLWKCFSKGALEKSELEKTLRAHKEACDSMNSEERERCALLKKAVADNNISLTSILRSYYKGEIKAKELNEVLKAHHGY